MNFKNLLKDKKSKPIIFLAVFIIVAAIVYLVLYNTVLKPEKEEELPTIGNHGESMIGGKPFVMEPVDVDKIVSVEVKNEFEGFKLYKADDKEFYFEGAEQFLYDVTSDWQTFDYEDLSDALASMSMVDNLIGISRYMLATTEVTDFDKTNLKAYGLDNGGKASLTLTFENSSGKEFTQTVRFGNKTTAGGGYYVALDGRDALYVVADSGISRCIFTDIKSYFSTLITANISTTKYMDADSFTINKHGKTYIDIVKLNEDEKDISGNLYTHKIVQPDDYYPSSEMLEKLFSTFVSFSGNKVVEYGIAEKLADDSKFDEVTEMFKLYSLLDKDNNWVNQVIYNYNDLDIHTTIYISEKLKVQSEESEEQYIYYVFSPSMDTIVEIDAEKLTWIDEDFIKYVESHTYSIMINSVDTIAFDYGTTHVSYSLSGDDNELSVKNQNGERIDTTKFRQLYKALLYATIDGYAEVSDQKSLLLTVTVKLENGVTSVYKFYGLTARKAYYTVNDEGQFYVNRDYVKQLVSASDTLIAGGMPEVSEKF